MTFDLKDITGAHLASVKIKVQLELVSDSQQDTIHEVDAAISRLDNALFSKIPEDIDASAIAVKAAYSSTEMASSCIPSLGQVFETVVKIARTFSDVCLSHIFNINIRHRIVLVSFCIADSSDIESFVYSSLLGVRGQYFVVVTLKECRLQWDPSKAWKDQLLQDQSVQNLAESLREMVCAANECPDLSVIKGTEDVIEAIGRVSLEITSFIDEYARRTFAGESIAWLCWGLSCC